MNLISKLKSCVNRVRATIAHGLSGVEGKRMRTKKEVTTRKKKVKLFLEKIKENTSNNNNKKKNYFKWQN